MFTPPNYGEQSSFTAPKFGPWSVLLYLHRKYILNAVLLAKPYLQGRLLDVGCGNKPYRSIIGAKSHIGIDIASSPHEHDNFDRTFDGVNIPFAAGEFDAVLCTEVIEHSQEPSSLLCEIGRVLKTGGHALVTVPFVIPHHETPYDFQRFTYYGLQYHLAKGNMEIVWALPRGGVLATTVAMMHFAVSSLVSRRPFADLAYFTLFPFFYVLMLADRRLIRRSPIPAISLGWQVLAKKTAK